MDMYSELKKQAQTHKTFYHYTSLKGLKCILKKQSLRLSRIDLVNDPKENERIKVLWGKKIFLLCLTHDIDNENYFYENYCKIRLEFDSKDLSFDSVYFWSDLSDSFDFFYDNQLSSVVEHKSYRCKKDWCVYDVSLADVYYTDSLKKHEKPDGSEENAGLIKLKRGTDINGNNREWAIEKETRLRVTLRPIGLENLYDLTTRQFIQPSPCFKYVYVPLPKISGISVSPNVSEKEKEYIVRVIKQYELMK